MAEGSEANRLAGRVRRYARVGTAVGGIAARFAGQRLGWEGDRAKNAAELALAEFNQPNIQLLVKDDGGTPQGAQAAAQQALAEGTEII
ncbi:MAG: penicillin-binding protein activator, partial [Alphaproteobacteria bacterium]